MRQGRTLKLTEIVGGGGDLNPRPSGYERIGHLHAVVDAGTGQVPLGPCCRRSAVRRAGASCRPVCVSGSDETWGLMTNLMTRFVARGRRFALRRALGRVR